MNVATSLIWRIMQQYSVYAVKIVVQMVLARLLAPAEFGLIATVSVFTSISEILAISGLGTALVQKHNSDEKDYSTVLTTSLAFSLLIYCIIFFVSPLISRYYENQSLVSILRVYSLAVFIQSYLALINAYVQKKFLFKKSFIGNFVSTIIAGAISIFLAYQGFGVWTLVLYGLLSPFLSIICTQFLVHWHPPIGFSFERFKALFSFSWKVLASNLIGSLLENIYNLTIGKYYGSTTLGYYKQGNTYPDAILGQTRTAFGAVILPVYSSLQNDIKKLQLAIERMTHIITALIFPMAFGLAAIAESFIVFFLTDKWVPAVFFLRLECVFYGTLPITTSLGYGIMAIGRSDISVKIELSKLIATMLCVILFHGYGVEFLCIARVVIAVLFIFVSAYLAHRIIGLSLYKILLSILKPLILSAVMGGVVYSVSFLELECGLILFIQIVVGLSIYGLGSFLFMREDLIYFKNLIIRKD